MYLASFQSLSGSPDKRKAALWSASARVRFMRDFENHRTREMIKICFGFAWRCRRVHILVRILSPGRAFDSMLLLG